MSLAPPLLEDEELLLHVERDADSGNPLHLALSDQRVYFAKLKSFRLASIRFESVGYDEIIAASIARVSRVGQWFSGVFYGLITAALVTYNLSSLIIAGRHNLGLWAAALAFGVSTFSFPRAATNRRALTIQTKRGTFYWKAPLAFSQDDRDDLEQMFATVADILRSADVPVTE